MIISWSSHHCVLPQFTLVLISGQSISNVTITEQIVQNARKSKKGTVYMKPKLLSLKRHQCPLIGSHGESRLWIPGAGLRLGRYRSMISLSGSSLLFPLPCFEEQFSLMYCVSTTCGTYSLASHKYLLSSSNCHEAFISHEPIRACFPHGKYKTKCTAPLVFST